MVVSLGAPTISWTINNAIADAFNDGIFVAAAAGNGGSDFIGDLACLTSPGSSEEAMVVGSVTSDYKKPGWSNYG